MKTTLLSIILSGQDVSKFIQRIITQDIHQCTSPTLSCICNASGKVTFVFWIKATTDQVQIWIDESLIDDLCQCIRYYDPFEQIQITPLDQPITSDALNIPSNTSPWPLYLIQQTIPILPPEHQNRYTPQMLALNQTLSLSKGCFIGHEVIARIHFKGKTKRTLQYHTETSHHSKAINTYYSNNTYHHLTITSH